MSLVVRHYPCGPIMIIDHPATYGAKDRLICDKCGGNAMLTRRSPHPDAGDKYEMQIFLCLICGDEKSRTADVAGKPRD